MSLYKKLVDYWTIIPPVYLQHQKNWDGVTIVPECQENSVLQTVREEEDVTIFSTKNDERIVRKFGDILCDEVTK